MPGGFGTFEEFCEVVTWTQLGVHRKSCGLLNVGGFYDPFIAQFDRGVADGFIKTGNRRIVVAHADPVALLDAIARIPPPPEAPWISSPDET
jgi:predicted Rossmann-fold nucleotide-binding protein